MLMAGTSGKSLLGAQRGGQRLPDLVRRGPKTEKVIALTFDDGPDPRFTPRILAILKERHVRATFFMVGRNAEKYPSLVKLIDENGDVIGNHTYSHPDLRVESQDQMRLEITRCEDILQSITGKRATLFRPPKGFYDRRALQMLSGLDLQPILWALTVEHKACATPEDMAQRVMQKIEPGEILLAHDGRLNREKTVEAMPLIIDGLKSRGYRFVTVPEMLELLRESSDTPARRAFRFIDGNVIVAALKRVL
jgi:peptidoglycan/xylan/chitin deacetylase (PgdA/CDA1 family)